MRYLLALNQCGRGQIILGEVHDIVQLLNSVQQNIVKSSSSADNNNDRRYCGNNTEEEEEVDSRANKVYYGFDFVSLAYGLLRENPSIWIKSLSL